MNIYRKVFKENKHELFKDKKGSTPNRCLLKKDKNALAYGVEGGDSSGNSDVHPKS